VVEVVRRSGDRPTVAITAHSGSALAAAATVTVLQHVESQRAVTHTQALSGAYACGLALWAELTGDAELRRCLATAPAQAARAVAEAEEWAAERVGGLAPPAAAVVVGGGTAWAAALELALMLKEISRVPTEGVETREGATSAMFGLAPGHLVASFDPPGDPLGDEALRLCAEAGATTLRVPGVAGADTRLAPITTIPGAAALSAALAQAGGHDVDRPSWTDAYYETARSAT
jgi:fructoselysine-6-P-deglycase FrlB-like protein